MRKRKRKVYLYGDVRYYFSHYTFWGKIKRLPKLIKYARQRITKGYCDADVWNVDATSTYLLHHLLMDFSEMATSYPQGYTWEKWKEDLYDAAMCFHCEDEEEWDIDNLDTAKLKRGLNFIYQKFYDLWD